MLKSFYLVLILFNVVFRFYAVLTTFNEDNSVAKIASAYNSNDCQTNSLESSFYCRGSRAIRNVIKNLNKSDKPLVIVRGLEIVRSNNNANETKAINSYVNDDSILGRFSEYLQTHELNIKFSDLLAEENENFLATDMERNDVKIGTTVASNEEARKKDKGQGILVAMALMFGKIMAVMGLGGIGALAMKALGVSMAALMMAGIVGLKSLSQHGGGHETSHSVQYLNADGHLHRRRRRRSLELIKSLYTNNHNNEEPFRAWLKAHNEIAK